MQLYVSQKFVTQTLHSFFFHKTRAIFSAACILSGKNIFLQQSQLIEP